MEALRCLEARLIYNLGLYAPGEADDKLTDAQGRENMRVLIRPRNFINQTALCSILVALVFLPSALMIFVGASSFALGVLVTAAYVVLAYLAFEGGSISCFRLFNINAIVSVGVVLFFIIIHFVLLSGVLSSYNNYDIARFLTGFLGLSLMLVASLCVARASFEIDHNLFSRVIYIAFSLVVVNVIISAFRIDFFNTGNTKPSFLFSEPSHIAITASALVMYVAVMSSRIKCLLIVLFTLAWAIYIQNLTTIILGLMVAFVCIKLNIILISLFSSFLFVLIYIFLEQIDGGGVSYFLDRLSFDPDSENLSALVFMQGWDNARLTLIKTMGLGAGYQQLGVFTEVGAYTNKVIDIVGHNPNRYDGGTTGSKVVSEFGFLGIIAILVHLILVIRCVVRVRRRVMGAPQHANDTFASCAVICSSLELYVRGVGYFSPLIFMFWVGFFVIIMRRQGVGG